MFKLLLSISSPPTPLEELHSKNSTPLLHSRRRPPPPMAPMAPKLLVVVVCVVAVVCAAADPDDERCLSEVHASLADPGGSLRNWSRATFASPCNGFTSYLQGATCNNGRVYKLSLPGLSLSGALSPFLSNCSDLQTLDLSSNSLSGPIPPALSLLLNLAVLNLSSNLLSGPIPPDLSLCAYLNVIDLHSNLLSGPIPDQLALLVRLSAFDVSSNRLSGPVPVLLANRSLGSPLPRFNASSFAGNRGLYGYPLPPAPRGPRALSVWAIVAIGLASGMLSLVLSFSAVCLWLRLADRRAALMIPPSAAADDHHPHPHKISHLMPDY